MRVIYFRRDERWFHIHAGSYAACLYVPEENVILYKEQLGTFGGIYYSLTNNPKLLEEAKSIAEGRIPKKERVTFSDIKEFEYDSSKIWELIKKARIKKRLETEVKCGIEELLKQVDGEIII